MIAFCVANEIIYKERIIANGKRRKDENALACVHTQNNRNSNRSIMAMVNQRLFTIPHIAYGGAHSAHAHYTYTHTHIKNHSNGKSTWYSPIYHRVSHCTRLDNWSPLVSVFMRTERWTRERKKNHILSIYIANAFSSNYSPLKSASVILNFVQCYILGII